MLPKIGDIRGKVLDFLSWLRYGKMDKDIRVLMFHDISEPTGFGPRRYSVSEEDFERVISGFSDNYEFVKLESILSYLQGEKDVPDKAIAVTFDDGYLSTKEKALPVLEKYSVPATVFVPSNFLDMDYMYNFRLASLIRDRDALDFEYEGQSYSFNLENKDKKGNAYRNVKEMLRNSEIGERQEFLNSLAKKSPDSGLIMDKQDLKDIDNNRLISIGAHSTDHRRLTDISSEEARKSVIESKRSLEEILGHEVSSFSFPFGAKNKELIKMVKEAGYENAVVTEEREISERDWGKVYRIPRVDGKDL